MFKIEPLKEDELTIIYDLIIEMATFEKLTDKLSLTIDKLDKYIFKTNLVKASLLKEDNIVVGYIIYYLTFSSFTGAPSLYLEDIYVKEEYRHKGYGSACFKYLARVAIKTGCERIDFVCLNWNKNAQQFYQKIGAEAHPEWLLERMELDKIKKIVGEE